MLNAYPKNSAASPQLSVNTLFMKTWVGVNAGSGAKNQEEYDE
jgi:hypothetical protein